VNTAAIFVVIPLVMAVIGLVTKWVAIKLIFHPAEWVGIGPIGWQGIVQRRSAKFAAGIADTVLGAGLDVEAILERVDAVELAALLDPSLDKEAPTLVPALAEAVRPGLWEELAPPARDAITAQLQTEGRRIAVELVEELRPVAAELLDVKAMIVAELSGENADRLARLLQRVAGRELRILIGYGGILGLLMGFVAAAGYSLIERWWLMPFVGALDGLVNNWLAIQMIFRPIERTKYLGLFPYQGLFHARKKEIASEYSAMLAEEVLTPESILSHVGSSPEAHRLYQVGLTTLSRELETQIEVTASLLGEDVDEHTKTRVMGVLATRLQAVLPDLLPDLENYLTKRLEIASTLEGALLEMPPKEFESVLRGIFTEDERTIVIIGGAIGAVIGLGQAALVLALVG